MTIALIIDVVAVLVLLISALVSFLRGFIREFLTVLGVIGGFFAAVFFAPLLSPLVYSWFGIEEGDDVGRLFGAIPYDYVAEGLSYGGIFVAVLIALSIVNHFISNAISSAGLGAIDRTFGVIFGLVRGVLLLGLLYLPLHMMLSDEEKDSYFGESRSHVYIEMTASWLSTFLPGGAEEVIEENAAKTGDLLEETRKKLQAIDVLRSDDSEEEKEKASSTNAGASNTDKPDHEEGYKKEERTGLEKLIEQETKKEFTQ